MRITLSKWGALAATALLTPICLFAQSVNVDLDASQNAGAGAPATSFGGAAGQPGFWTALTRASETTLPLFDLSGAPTGITLTRSSASGGNFGFNNSATSGDFELLLDDCQRLSSAGGTVTYTITGLTPGAYTVYTYAIAPDNDNDRTKVSVAGSTSPNPQTIGGGMPINAFALGVTHARHDVQVAGTLTITAERFSPAHSGSVNGIQLVYAGPVGACCLDTLTCIQATATNCNALGGIYQGDHTVCGQTPCPCVLSCPVGGRVSIEPNCGPEYDDVTNGGCYAATTAFEPISCGETVCGTAGTYMRDGYPWRDLDWYRFVLTSTMSVTWSAQAEFPLQISLAANLSTTGGDCPASVLASLPLTAEEPDVDPCEPGSVSITLPPGIYYAVIGPRTRWLNVDCASAYVATLTCAPDDTPPCDFECDEECSDPENEPECGPDYVDTFNGGCSATPHTFFSEIACGQKVCGRSGTFLRGGVPFRDEDWYSLVLAAPCDLFVSVTAQFPVQVLVQPASCAVPPIAGQAWGACEPNKLRLRDVPAGSYWVVVRPLMLTDVPCGSQYILEVTCCTDCDDEPASVDAQGNLIPPPDYDPNQPITLEEGADPPAAVSQRYPQYDTSLDDWYGCHPCDWSVGGELPNDLMQQLQTLLDDAGYVGVPAEEIGGYVEQWETEIGEIFAKEPDRLDEMARVSDGYTPPPAPHCTQSGCRYVFGGRDIVFVHGLRTTPILARVLGNSESSDASITWAEPQSFPGWTDNPTFYDLRCESNGPLGYWKRGANRYWRKHIEKFLRERGIMNRYLIVCYPATDRIDVGIHAILTQIADAMNYGVGVVDPADPCTAHPVDLSDRDETLPPSPRRTPSNFGTPSFVIVSHSTGGPVTSLAMAAAATKPNLNAQFIAEHCKAHIALHAVFSGSREATAAVQILAGTSFGILGSVPHWACRLVVDVFGAASWNCNNLPNPLAVLRSNLVDDMPMVMQVKWRRLLRQTPVRTLTVVGGHPSFYIFAKPTLLPGFDDGVSNINSQVGNPNYHRFWPSGYLPKALPYALPPPLMPSPFPKRPSVFDMGVAFGNGQTFRAVLFYIDQVVDRFFSAKLNVILHRNLVAGAATPYVSTTGMVQPVLWTYFRHGGFNSLNRLPNHFSFIQSTAAHFDSTPSHDDDFAFVYPNYPNYTPTMLGGGTNNEETRVLTDPAVYWPFNMPYTAGLGIDNQPLLTLGAIPENEEITRYKRWKLFTLGGRQRYLYLWKRNYHLLQGWQTKHAMDYVYEYVLPDPVYACGGPVNDCNENGIDDSCETVLVDCNGNHVPDDCDIARGTSQDTNHDGVPDECQRRPLGDVNCDWTLNNFDIDPFVLALTDPAGYDVAFPDCDILLADINGDGAVNNFDIDAFVALLIGP